MGPLSDVKIVEFAGIGPAPLAAMLLADMGATVLLIDRPTDTDLGVKVPPKVDFTKRNRALVRLDLKRPEAITSVLRLIDGADGLIEGFRPGVMERLGLGPDGLPGTQQAPGLRARHRLGAGGAAVASRRPRHELHRADRRAACDRPRGAAADAAAEPGRRLWRRRFVFGDRIAGRDHQRPGNRPRAGGGRGHGRWRAVADDADLRDEGRRADERPARTQPARQRRVFL